MPLVESKNSYIHAEAKTTSSYFVVRDIKPAQFAIGAGDVGSKAGRDESEALLGHVLTLF